MSLEHVRTSYDEKNKTVVIEFNNNAGILWGVTTITLPFDEVKQMSKTVEKLEKENG